MGGRGTAAMRNSLSSKGLPDNKAGEIVKKAIENLITNGSGIVNVDIAVTRAFAQDNPAKAENPADKPLETEIAKLAADKGFTVSFNTSTKSTKRGGVLGTVHRTQVKTRTATFTHTKTQNAYLERLKKRFS